MKIEYDRNVDILYIKLKDAKITDTGMPGEDIYVDMDKNQNFVGIEIWSTSKNATQPIPKRYRRRRKSNLTKSVLKPKSRRQMLTTSDDIG